jgi:predicted Rossmann fold nucleotide-binding protein DprA/Smf involved in DNA uptake
MERNKLIYNLADAALVVASSDEQGGTWSGAVEALKQRQIPIYVKASGEIPVGNRKLIESGGQEFPLEPWNDFHQLFENSAPPTTLSFADSQAQPEAGNDVSVSEQPAPDSPVSAPTAARLELAADRDREGSDAYDHVIEVMLATLTEPLDQKSLAVKLNVLPSQAGIWLKRAVQEGRVRKTRKPLRYVRTSTPLSLFPHKSEADLNKRS